MMNAQDQWPGEWRAVNTGRRRAFLWGFMWGVLMCSMILGMAVNWVVIWEWASEGV